MTGLFEGKRLRIYLTLRADLHRLRRAGCSAAAPERFPVDFIARKTVIEILKDTPDGFLSDYLPFRRLIVFAFI